MELKSTKKGKKSNSEFVLRIKAIANTLLAVGDSISEQDQIDSILDGLLEECNPFVMQMYESTKPSSLCDVEAQLYVQEAQVDKFRQELSISIVAANLANTSQETTSSRGAFSGNHGRGACYTRGLACGRGRATSGNRPTCQLCDKYGHSITDCWHRFDETFRPHNPSSSQTSVVNESTTKYEKSKASSQKTQAYTQEYSLPSELES